MLADIRPIEPPLPVDMADYARSVRDQAQTQAGRQGRHTDASRHTDADAGAQARRHLQARTVSRLLHCRRKALDRLITVTPVL